MMQENDGDCDACMVLLREYMNSRGCWSGGIEQYDKKSMKHRRRGSEAYEYIRKNMYTVLCRLKGKM